MRLYTAVARMAFRRQSTYRGAMIAGGFTNLVFGFILASVLRSVLGGRAVGGLTSESATAFVFLSQGLIATVSLFGDFSLVAAVRNGDVAIELLRPWNWLMYRLSADLGKSVFQTLTRGIAIAVPGWIAYRLALPNLSLVLPFLVTVLLAVVLASQLWTLCGVASFWLVDGSGVMQLAVALAMVGSGLNLPLPLYPSWLQPVLYASPFSGLVQGPADVLLGLRSIVPVVAHQLVWILVLNVGLRIELRAAVSKLEIQGG